ncbi:(2,3-dihydroxybenzoyl)adenylate synthase [Streptomyces sp. NPDC001118]
MKRAGVVPWPEEKAAHYTSEGIWLQRPLGWWMWRWADRYSDRIALVDGEQRISYRELAERADSLAEHLLGLGLSDGDSLLVQLPNCWEHVVLFLACQRIGVAPLLALLAHREHELTHLADAADAAAVAVPSEWKGFDHAALAERVAATRPGPCPVLVVGDRVGSGHTDVRAAMSVHGDPAARRARLSQLAPDPSDVALFLLSGGTTGLPKIIARTHNDYEYNLRRSGQVCAFDERTVYLAALPAAHNFPLGCPGILGTLAVGGRAVMSPSPRAEVALALVAEEAVTVTSVVPAVARTWLAHAEQYGLALPSLRLLQVGGSVMPADLARRLGPTLGCTLQQVFGMAEGLVNFTRPDDPWDIQVGTQGRPMSKADEILIVDADGRPVSEGREGELLTRGPYTPRGYFNAPEHNRRAFTPDGWYRTGDVVRMHPSGNLIVEGRTKDLVNRGGEKISLDEVEELVRSSPEVKDAAALAWPHPELGECVCVCVVPTVGQHPTPESLGRHLATRGVAAFKFPEAVFVVGELPLTPIGKVDRKALRTRVADRSPAWSLP